MPFVFLSHVFRFRLASASRFVGREFAIFEEDVEEVELAAKDRKAHLLSRYLGFALVRKVPLQSWVRHLVALVEWALNNLVVVAAHG